MARTAFQWHRAAGLKPDIIDYDDMGEVYFGPVLEGDEVFLAPGYANYTYKMAVWNMKTKTLTQIGAIIPCQGASTMACSMGSGKAQGFVMPVSYHAIPFVKVEIATKTVTQFGTANVDHGRGNLSTRGFAIGASNGFIYHLNDLLIQTAKVDPVTEAITYIGPGDRKRYSAPIEVNGKIYTGSAEQGMIGVFDLATDTYSEFSLASGYWITAGLHRALNGNIYSYPQATQNIQKVDLVGQTSTSIGPTFTSNATAMVNGPNGNIYILTATELFELNPNTDTVTKISPTTKANHDPSLFMILYGDGNAYGFGISGKECTLINIS